MATWDNVVYTTHGLNLMAKLQTGATLHITRAVGGDGHASADALPALTEIAAKQTLTLSDPVYKGNGRALLPVTLYNRGLTGGYILRQIGIYATDPDDGEVLMLVAQSETPDTIPSELASPDFVANFSFHIALGNAGRINVTYSLTDMATKADYAAFVEQIEDKLAQPNGIATLDGSGKLAQMPTAADVGAVPTTDKGKPGGVATLNGLGELYQMPSAFAVNAISSRWIVLIMEDKAVPNRYSCNDYTTPGDVISIANYAAAQSFANLPEAVPGKLYTLPLRTDDQGRNDIMQEYHTVTGNVWCRRKFYYSGNTWNSWSTAVRCSDPQIGDIYVAFGGGMHICAGSKTWADVAITSAPNAGCYTSSRLYFSDFPRAFASAPKCIISLSVGRNGPYWVTVDSNGPTTTRPQSITLTSTASTIVSSVTLSYIAIGVS